VHESPRPALQRTSRSAGRALIVYAVDETAGGFCRRRGFLPSRITPSPVSFAWGYRSVPCAGGLLGMTWWADRNAWFPNFRQSAHQADRLVVRFS